MIKRTTAPSENEQGGQPAAENAGDHVGSCTVDSGCGSTEADDGGVGIAAAAADGGGGGGSGDGDSQSMDESLWEEVIAGLLFNPLGADVLLLVSGSDPLPAHSQILMSRSAAFVTILQHAAGWQAADRIARAARQGREGQAPELQVPCASVPWADLAPGLHAPCPGLTWLLGKLLGCTRLALPSLRLRLNLIATIKVVASADAAPLPTYPYCSFNYTGVGLATRLSPTHVGSQIPTVRPVRYCATHAKPEDRSWGDIAADAAELAKAVGSKVVQGIKQAATGVKEALVPQAKPAHDKPSHFEPAKPSSKVDRAKPSPKPATTIRPRPGHDLGEREPWEGVEPWMGGFGGLMDGVVEQLGNKMAEVDKERDAMAKADKERDAVIHQAAHKIRTSSIIKTRLGGEVKVLTIPISQSSSSVSINGVSSKKLTLVLPVVGSKVDGVTAYATVESSTGARGSGSLKVKSVSQSTSTVSINGVSSKKLTLVLPMVGSKVDGMTAYVTVESSAGARGSALLVKVQMAEGDWVVVDGAQEGLSSTGTIDVEFEELSTH
eukprot:gene30367-35372_t